LKVVRSLAELRSRPRAVAVGSFDGVHVGHRAVLAALRSSGGVATVVTFDPHPRGALLLATLERRLELLDAEGVEEVLVLPPRADVAAVVAAIRARVVVGGPASGVDALARRAMEIRPVPLVEGVSSDAIRALVAAGDVTKAARLLGRPPEVEGVVVAGHARGAGLGFPTANVDAPADLVVPARGIYAGEARGHRAAVSIGVNPHFGGGTLSVEAFLLDFTGDLYGQRLVVELWRFLRSERAFASQAELVAAIARDVEAASSAVRPP
jgi:riboflavin kinase/FMN adenylyltransferase